MIDAARIRELTQHESERFARARPRSRALHEQAAGHWPGGVPLHWMRDWGTPFPVYLAQALGAELLDVDGHDYVDFCLGDTGAMFGHSPDCIARAIAAQSARGLTTMLPDERVAAVGERLAARFGLPLWQITQTATDANRAVLRWARAITERRRVLVFHGCYHGTVDETLVRLTPEGTRARSGAIGPAFDPSVATTAIEFNDVAALEAALESRDYAVVLCEPVMTNAGMVLPDPGFHDALRELTRRHGTLLAIDETHTLSSGLGGYSRVYGLEPDFFICGKAIAGGLPCAVFGFTADVGDAMARVSARVAADHGHSGMGTTLAANPLVIAALAASLDELLTDDNYRRMEALASGLERGLAELFAARRLPWHVSRVGARVEFGFVAPAPRNGSESLAALRPELEHLLHLYLLNRGLLVTPFHNMMLTAPCAQASDVTRLVATLDDALSELMP